MKWWMVVGGILLVALVAMSTWNTEQRKRARIERLEAVSKKSAAHDFSAKIFANCMVDLLADVSSCEKRVVQMSLAKGGEAFSSEATKTLPEVESAYFGR